MSVAPALRVLGVGAGLILALAVLAFTCRMIAPARVAQAPPPGDCVEIELVSNGWHSDLIVPAGLFPAEHPLRRIFPRARRLSIGWGDRDAYRFGAQQPWLHVLALLPQRSVMHVAAESGWAGTHVAVSREQAGELVRYIGAELRLAPDGRAIYVGPGNVPGRSVFLEATQIFSALNVCNHWMARALRAAGLPVSDFGAWTGEAVRRQLGAGSRCPPTDSRRIGPEALSSNK